MLEDHFQHPKIDPYSLDGIILNNMKGSIRLKNVHFSYPSRKSTPVRKCLFNQERRKAVLMFNVQDLLVCSGIEGHLNARQRWTEDRFSGRKRLWKIDDYQSAAEVLRSN